MDQGFEEPAYLAGECCQVKFSRRVVSFCVFALLDVHTSSPFPPPPPIENTLVEDFSTAQDPSPKDVLNWGEGFSSDSSAVQIPNHLTWIFFFWCKRRDFSCNHSWSINLWRQLVIVTCENTRKISWHFHWCVYNKWVFVDKEWTQTNKQTTTPHMKKS